MTIAQHRISALILPLGFLMFSCSDDATTAITPPTIPNVRIVELVPHVNNEGDSGVENWTIRNFDIVDVDMNGWSVIDPESSQTYTWSMAVLGVLKPGEQKTFTSTVVAKLNNNGDDLILIAPDSTRVQTITFGKVDTGQVVRP